MGAVLVVVVAELVQLALQFRQGRCVAGGETLLQRLPEPFDFPLGSGFVGAAVLLRDSVQCQEGLERVPAGSGAGSAGEAGGEDVAVVGQRRRRVAVFGGGLFEGVGDGAAGDAGVAGQVGEVAGVVVEPGDDLDLAAVGESPVGGVGLPDLVGSLGREPVPGRPGPLLRLRGDRVRGVQDPRVSDCLCKGCRLLTEGRH